MFPRRFLPLLFTGVLVLQAFAQDQPAITFNQSFQGGTIGKIEKADATTFRCFVEGQYDERGRNRQVSWFYFRMENVLNREVSLTFTDFVGEYNDKPGACAMNADIRPVFSYDNEHWQFFSAMDWDNTKKEATLKFKAEQNQIWIAHQVPYTHERLLRFLREVDQSPLARVEVIGKTVQGRDLHMVTVTNPAIPDAQKKTVWLQARQHAWESGTSFAMEGALRFVISDDPKAKTLRDKIVFKFTPMVDPDGCANGKIRFNGNGYDVNRHWAEMDLRSKELLERMPEIWYAKKAILGYVDAGHPIHLMVNLHNTETNEYVDTQADDSAVLAVMQRFFDKLNAQTIFDPSSPLKTRKVPATDTNSLYPEKKIPVMLMELRIGTSKKIGHRPTYEERQAYGSGLITAMAESVLE